MMPEMRNASRTVLADPSGGGFFLRRMTSPGAAVVMTGAVKPIARRVLPPSSNKENMPPSWAVRTTPKRSPLPEWYPRTPLHDITSIVKAIERKSRLRNAAAPQQIQWTEDLATPAQTEEGISQSTPTQKTLDVVVASCPGSTQVVSSTATYLAEGNLKAPSSTSDCSLKTPSKPNDPAHADFIEKKLSSSIEQIENMVNKNLKRAPKAAQPSKSTVQRRTLMSMR
ncbi:hypothetical protein GUJ93_ZPchr0002g25518 [Zizania palustris]|nr:hypothetical protein GUJ93_ZPchr0002g25518 [Zizania palustris]KAG8060463.1 hypothetical protein GUJ93_ZPchr0002g25518 [Zizania palustris]KAG8060465.1 hypothetical protein GUJ93_ZPchr0002g25518 [Zizania palustris]